MLSHDLRALRNLWHDRLRCGGFDARTGPEITDKFNAAIALAERLEATCVAQATRLTKAALACRTNARGAAE